MLISQKRNCNRCIAFREIAGNGPVSDECPLGYWMSLQGMEEHMAVAFGVPLEPCPKPLTISDYIEAGRQYRQRQMGRRRHQTTS